MIKKLISIEHFGTFENFNIKNSDWDGLFKKVNVIYGGNGKGKTSFSIILQSLSNDDMLMTKKTHKHSANLPKVEFVDEDNKLLKYTGTSWNRNLSNVEVFNSLYLEDNTYTISYRNVPNELNIFELNDAEKISKDKVQLVKLNNTLLNLRRQINNINYLTKQYGDKYNGKVDLTKLPFLREKQKSVISKIKSLEDEINQKTNYRRELYFQKINNYLEYFGVPLRLTNMKLISHGSSTTQKLIFGLNICGNDISVEDRESTDNNSLKYLLSEGDKNALSLSSFLAKFDIIPDTSKYVVVVDDPFTSFDFDRKRATITQLVRLSKNISQLFILTHDLHFKNDFLNAYLNKDILSLKISRKNNSCGFFLQNTKKDMLTGFLKDITTIDDFIENPNDDQLIMRDVVRCLRPAMEGIIRLKYKNLINENEWLGDFIQKIRNSDSQSSLFRLKDKLNDLEEINDYSKSYHHSNPNYMENEISEKELLFYCKKTRSMIEFI